MALNASPRKLTVPLATGDEPRNRPHTAPAFTKRVFYCAVVVEGADNGRELPEDIKDLVRSFGDSPDDDELLSSDSAVNPHSRPRALTDTSALAANIVELVTTERTYVKRLQILKADYADPLRNFAKSKGTALIPSYEAKTLFGNIDHLLPVNEAFLADLERMAAPNGSKTVGGVGDVALKHFKELKGFELYRQYYAKREEAQRIFMVEYAKKSQFYSYVERIKYQATDPKNRVGLRELLMEPVQRIPRYTLLFREMLNHMAADDPQRAKILEADQIASNIAQAETDEKTKRAMIFSCLTRNIDGFPANLSSHSRKFIDCIDVQDTMGDGYSSLAASPSTPSSSLPCTLFLFDDKLVIVKRAMDKSGRTLSGVDNAEKIMLTGALGTRKRSGLSFKGVVDITDVVATDISGPEFHLYLENPPQDQTDRWSERPFRSMVVVLPPHPLNFDPGETESHKRRFLENLWMAQGKFRTKAGQSVLLQSPDQEVDVRAHRLTVARAYYNVYQRTAFLQEPKKTKVVVHIDPSGCADPIPFGMGGPPLVVIRIQPMAGELCRYTVTSREPTDEGEEDIVQTARVPGRIVQTIHQFGLFEFTTGHESRPSTPTHRSKVALFGLDAISRNLFHGRPASVVGDFFVGSINGHRRHRSRSTTSRTSMYTQSTITNTTDSSAKFSSRSGSTVTAATTISSMEEDDFCIQGGKRSLDSARPRMPEFDLGEGRPTTSRPTSRLRSHSVASTISTELEYSDPEDDNTTILAQDLPTSDADLNRMLELARQNSMNQSLGKPLPPIAFDGGLEEPIYEEEPPSSLRPSRSTSRSRSQSLDVLSSPMRHPRSLSQQSVDRRPLGPRSPSPMPMSLDELGPPPDPDPDPDATMEVSPRQLQHALLSSAARTSGIPRSTRTYPSKPYIDATPTASTSTPVAATEPLAIKKKSSVRTASGGAGYSALSASASGRRPRKSSVGKSGQRVVTPRRVSPAVKRPSLTKSTAPTPGLARTGTASSGDHAPPTSSLASSSRPLPVTRSSASTSTSAPGSSSALGHSMASTSSTAPVRSEDLELVHELARATREEIETSRRMMKRIKLEVENTQNLRRPPGDDGTSRPTSPEKILRAATQSPPLTRAAQERLEEMRTLINRRNEPLVRNKFRNSIFEGRPRSGSATAVPPGHSGSGSGSGGGSSGSMFGPSPLATAGSSSSIDSILENPSRTLTGLVETVEASLLKAESSQSKLQAELDRLAREYRGRTVELERAKLDLHAAKRQYELVKSLFDDASTEKEIMYSTFNEELEQLFQEACLPDDEAWRALENAVSEAKDQRNKSQLENTKLKERLAALELQNDEYAALLRANGLIS